jgi:hypothetical protein
MVRLMAFGRMTRIVATAALAGLATACSTGATAGARPLPAKAAPAVGVQTVTRTALRWRVQARLPEPARSSDQGFGAVSCASSSACLGIALADYPHGDFGGFAETWDGSHWRARSVPGKLNDSQQDVTCLSERWCLAVGTRTSGSVDQFPIAQLWNGKRWRETRPVNPHGSTATVLNAVACSSTRACTAVADQMAERWNGSRWKIQKVPHARGGGMMAVACPAANACITAGGNRPSSEIWNGSSWRLAPVPSPAGADLSMSGLEAISCTAANFCEAVGSYEKGKADTSFFPQADVWNGSAWHLQAVPAIRGYSDVQFAAVSCITATNCEAAGDAQLTANISVGLLEKWNGTKWSLQEIVRHAKDQQTRLEGISCTAGPVCEAVGFYQKSFWPNGHLLALRYSRP